MSLVENFVNQISLQGLGGITKPNGFDLSDDTFAKLLEKSMQSSLQSQSVDSQSFGLGIPAGMIIEPFEGTEPIQPLPQKNNIEALAETVEIKDVDFGGDYFSNLVKNSSDDNSSIIGCVKKHAAVAYNVFGRGLVTNALELMQDATNAL